MTAVKESLISVYRSSFTVLLVGAFGMTLLYILQEPGSRTRSLTAKIEFTVASESKETMKVLPQEQKGGLQKKEDNSLYRERSSSSQTLLSQEMLYAKNDYPENNDIIPNFDPYRMRSSEPIRSTLKTIRFLQGWQNMPGVVNSESSRLFPTTSLDSCGYRCKIEKGTSPAGADIAIFMGVGMNKFAKPPKKSQNDIWLFHTGESQYVYINGQSRWDGMFNYSTAYVREAGNHNTGWAQKFTMRPQSTHRNFAKERRQKLGKSASASALWFVSNCKNGGWFKPQSARVPYALELSKYINISAYTRSDMCRRPLATIIKKENKDKQPKFNDFLFYLSFENNVCKDYITEKLWKILSMETFTIPIVLGGKDIEDYYRLAPPNSFIHVRNFTSPKHLSDHLQYIATNDDAFNYYHQWRNDYVMSKTLKKERMLCHYCMLAHERPPAVWETFSQDFTSKDCKNLSEPEQYCSYYNMTCNHPSSK